VQFIDTRHFPNGNLMYARWAFHPLHTMLFLPTDLPRRRSPHLPLARALVLFIGAVCIGLVLMTLTLGWSARQQWLANASGATANLASSLAEHAETTLRQSDTVLREVVDRLEEDDFSASGMKRLREILTTRVSQQQQLHGLFVYDALGRWALYTRSPPHPEISNADREYFVYHREHADRGLHVGLPVQSKSNGEWILPLSRRLEHPDGSFAGVALATVRLAYFNAYYRKLDVGRHGLFVMALDSGLLLTRRPFRPELVGTSITDTHVFREYRLHGETSSLVHASPFDGIERQYAVKKLTGYPLMVMAAVPTAEILAGWRSRMKMQAGALAAMIALLGFGGHFLIRQVKLQAVARKRLNESFAKVRNLEQALDKHAILAVSDTRHRIVHANDRYCRISGYSREELLGRDANFMGAACQTPDFIAALRGTLESGEVWKGEICLLGKSGDIFWLNATIVPFLDEQGCIFQYVAIGNDISAQKEAEQQLLHAKSVLEQSNRELSALSRLDALTGLANRRAFDAALAAQCDPQLRNRQALALLMIDVDCFKAYNDLYGHPAGDECLRQLARVLKRQLKHAGDLAARYGGEEFTVLLTDKNGAGAIAVAERIRADLVELGLPHAGSPLGRVTVSIGYHVAEGDETLSQADMVAGADRALYKAKALGRDRALSSHETQACDDASPPKEGGALAA
jgi:diguanylate cyclase (GGDEF)-like protein/PAS domain S-box-containing protein